MCLFFVHTNSSSIHPAHISSLPHLLPPPHRSFMQVCQEALDLNGRLISTDQLLYQDELRSKFQQMQTTLTPLLKAEERVCVRVRVCVCMICVCVCVKGVFTSTCSVVVTAHSLHPAPNPSGTTTSLTPAHTPTPHQPVSPSHSDAFPQSRQSLMRVLIECRPFCSTPSAGGNS